MWGNTTTSRNGNKGIWVGVVSSDISFHPMELDSMKMGEKTKKFKRKSVSTLIPNRNQGDDTGKRHSCRFTVSRIGSWH
jgi:hypothetical protein